LKRVCRQKLNDVITNETYSLEKKCLAHKELHDELNLKGLKHV